MWMPINWIQAHKYVLFKTLSLVTKKSGRGQLLDPLLNHKNPRWLPLCKNVFKFSFVVDKKILNTKKEIVQLEQCCF